MNREQFIAQLARLLQDLPPAERQEAIRYYQEYFDDAGEENEDAVIQELGSPGKVAASIKANLQYGGSTFGANDTDMENTGTENQTKDADGWQQNGQTMNRWKYWMNISSTPLCITPIGPVPARLLYNISGCAPHIPDHRPSGTDLSAACEAPDTGWNRKCR